MFENFQAVDGWFCHDSVRQLGQKGVSLLFLIDSFIEAFNELVHSDTIWRFLLHFKLIIGAKAGFYLLFSYL